MENQAIKQNIMLVNLNGFLHIPLNTSNKEISGIQQTFHSIINSSVNSYAGSIIKNVGYAYLIVFKSASDVLRAGLKIESDVLKYSHRSHRQFPGVKISINTDEPAEPRLRDDIFRRAANTISKIKAHRKKSKEPARIPELKHHAAHHSRMSH